MASDRVSIIIPTRNDAAALGRTLDYLAQQPGIEAAEVVVATAGDREGAVRSVGGCARILWSEDATRAGLMNTGAAAASGAVLFFVHADSSPPRDALRLIEGVLRDGTVVGGAFEHCFQERDWRLRIISGINRARYRLTRNFYGDQGIFVRADIFRRMGGYRALRLMEDLDFTRRLKREGRSVLIPVPLTTSGRRFLARGPWRTFAFIVWLLGCYSLGLDTERYAERWRGPADQPPGSPWVRGRPGGARGARSGTPPAPNGPGGAA